MSKVLTAEVVARAIVAACMISGLDPSEAYADGRAKGAGTKGIVGAYGCRVLAAQGVRARLNARPGLLGRLFAVNPVDITPSAARKRGITTDQLLVISEAIAAASGGEEIRPAAQPPSRPAAQPPSREVRPCLTPVKPQVVKWSRWFVDAGWRLSTVADLFDVEPEALATALGR